MVLILILVIATVIGRELEGSQVTQWVKNLPANAGGAGSIPGSGRSLAGAQQPTPVFLPGESFGQRSLVGYSPWGHKESDTTEATEHRRYPFGIMIWWPLQWRSQGRGNAARPLLLRGAVWEKDTRKEQVWGIGSKFHFLVLRKSLLAPPPAVSGEDRPSGQSKGGNWRSRPGTCVGRRVGAIVNVNWKRVKGHL